MRYETLHIHEDEGAYVAEVYASHRDTPLFREEDVDAMKIDGLTVDVADSAVVSLGVRSDISVQTDTLDGDKVIEVENDSGEKPIAVETV